ncbi:MAG: hypothetical protein K6E29_03945 [Cyanobacteria bacterium RUI128]|nr:hypothetical protein [Cyanobacteria bacterium RUI128]
MNICSYSGVANYGYNKNCKAPQKSCVSFGDYKGHKDTERTPWGTTWGEERVSAENAAASKRAVQRDVLSRSADPEVRAHADKVGENPVLDAYLTQREFDIYHQKMMAIREAEEAKLRAAAGEKNYAAGESYDIKDEKGRVIERGTGDQWEKRYEYDINYHVNRFGEHYTMNGAVKETRPDDTYVIMASPNSRTRLEEKFKNESVEFVDNCTGKIKSIKLPDGRSFDLSRILMNVKQTENSRQYFSQYNDKTPVLEVFEDGTYVRS